LTKTIESPRGVILIYANGLAPRLAKRLNDGREWRPCIGESEEGLCYRIAMSTATDEIRTVNREALSLMIFSRG
jgi:hypothetical protein